MCYSEGVTFKAVRAHIFSLKLRTLTISTLNR